jgi:hypothetical protein
LDFVYDEKIIDNSEGMAYYSASSGEAFSKRAILKLKYPVEKGLIVNWDDADILINHILYYHR